MVLKASPRSLQHCHSLQTLNLNGNKIGFDGAKGIAEGLQHCHSLQTLDLKVNEIGSDGTKPIAEGLQHCLSLQTLNLDWERDWSRWCQSHRRGSAALPQSAGTGSQIKNAIGSDGAEAIAEGLQHCHGLQALNLQDNEIGPNGAKAIAEGLQHCRSLQTLNLD